jgi:predicted O-methyltransferase YrrM
MKLPMWVRRWIARIEAGSSGYLDQVGWIRTRAERVARDVRGEAMPWFTYPALHLLAERVQPGWRVLEFGAGMGTLWWSRHVREVVAIEHDADWADQVARECDARLVRVPAVDAADYLRPTFGTGPYDVVIVDGIFRNECLAAAPDLLGNDGVIVLDDAQREEYRPAVDVLRGRGFKLLELHGPQPVSKHPGCTAFLYRDANVLDL